MEQISITRNINPIKMHRWKLSYAAAYLNQLSSAQRAPHCRRNALRAFLQIAFANKLLERPTLPESMEGSPGDGEDIWMVNVAFD